MSDEEAEPTTVNKFQNQKYRFCPYCGSLVICRLIKGETDGYGFVCPVCPFMQQIKRKLSFKTKLERKNEDEDFVSQEERNKYRQRTDIVCPKCTHGEAYFHQMQTRSADEPMTIFYECCNQKCSYHWRD